MSHFESATGTLVLVAIFTFILTHVSKAAEQVQTYAHQENPNSFAWIILGMIAGFVLAALFYRAVELYFMPKGGK
jgi:uncharacterized membrane protein